MTDPRRSQIDIAERIQLKLLMRFEALLDAGKLSATDAATVARLLTHNGWTLDPTHLPQGLRDKLTSVISFDDGLDEDEGTIGLN